MKKIGVKKIVIMSVVISCISLQSSDYTPPLSSANPHHGGPLRRSPALDNIHPIMDAHAILTTLVTYGINKHSSVTLEQCSGDLVKLSANTVLGTKRAEELLTEKREVKEGNLSLDEMIAAAYQLSSDVKTSGEQTFIPYREPVSIPDMKEYKLYAPLFVSALHCCQTTDTAKISTMVIMPTAIFQDLSKQIQGKS
jgi:hypothetical protein